MTITSNIMLGESVVRSGYPKFLFNQIKNGVFVSTSVGIPKLCITDVTGQLIQLNEFSELIQLNEVNLF